MALPAEWECPAILGRLMERFRQVIWGAGFIAVIGEQGTLSLDRKSQVILLAGMLGGLCAARHHRRRAGGFRLAFGLGVEAISQRAASGVARHAGPRSWAQSMASSTLPKA